MLDLSLPPLAILVNVVALFAAAVIYRHLRRLSPYRPLDRQKPHEALAVLTVALRYNPDSPVLNQRLALLYLYYRDYSKALNRVGVCRKRLPRNPYFLCVEGVVRILSGEAEEGAKLMEEAWPQLTPAHRKALHDNVRRVLSAGPSPILVSTAFGPEYPLTTRFFPRLAGLSDATTPRTYRRLQLSRRRYLARVG